MKTKLIIGIMLYSCLPAAWGQVFHFSGRVTDEAHQPLEAAAVVLRSLPDSAYLTNAVTDKSGCFRLEVKEQREYLLNVSYLGFYSYEKKVSPGELGDLCLQEDLQTLGGVTIKAERKLVKSKNGKLIFNAQQMAQSRKSDNAMDLLLHLPGIRNEQNQLMLSGRAVTIMVDGKPSTLSNDDFVQLLQSMPVEQIADVELMHQAPASYHAKGAVVNFVTKRADRYGAEGLVRGQYLNRHHNSGKASANLRLSSPTTTLDFMYGMDRKNFFEPNTLDSYHKVGNEEFHIEQSSRTVNQDWMNNFKLGLSQQFADQSLLDLSYFGKVSPSHRQLGFADSNLETSSTDKKGKLGLHNVGLYYQSSFGLKVGADYTRFHSKDQQLLSITPKETNTTGVIHNRQGQTADRYKFFADMEHQLKKDWSLGYGTSYTYTRDKDYQIYTDNTTGKELFDTESPINEHLTDMYLSVAYGGSGKSTFNASMKAEYCKNERFSEWTFFPQLTYGYNESGDHALQVVLSSEKLYPSFWTLSESVSHINGYVEAQGTPGLKSMNTYTLNTNYILRQRYIFTLSGIYIDGPFFLIPYQAPDRLAMIYKTLNWDHEFRVEAKMFLPFSIGQLFSAEYELIGGYVEQHCDEFMDISFHRKMFNFSVDGRHYLNLNKHLLLELDLYGQSKTPHGICDFKGFIEASLALRWKFAHDKMTLSMRCTDLFNSSDIFTDTDYMGQRFSLSRFEEANRAFEVNLSYRFGGYKERASRRVDTGRFGH